MKDLFNLEGKRAIITGGAGMLGTQHARALLQKNCRVELWDIDSKALERAKHRLTSEFPNIPIFVTEIDISSEQEIKTILESYKIDSIKIDILINNASLNPKFSAKSGRSSSQFEDYPIDIWNQEIAVGLTGAMLCSKHVGGLMAVQKNGVILNIASDLSIISPDQRIYEVPGLENHLQFKKPVSYSVIKSGLLGLTKYLSTYWVDKGIRANSLSPGGVYEDQDPLFVENLVSRIPMARMANFDEYMGAIQFLCSDASAYMNGQNLVMDGGRSVW